MTRIEPLKSRKPSKNLKGTANLAHTEIIGYFCPNVVASHTMPRRSFASAFGYFEK